MIQLTHTQPDHLLSPFNTVLGRLSSSEPLSAYFPEGSRSRGRLSCFLLYARIGIVVRSRGMKRGVRIIAGGTRGGWRRDDDHRGVHAIHRFFVQFGS